jgi:Prokaryotic E2 family E
MPLLPEDAQHLADKGITYEVHEEAGMTCLLLPSWPLPSGLTAPGADVLIRLSPGYPDIAPDMWWVDPPLRRADGSEIPATQSMEQHLGRTWQRWSRHFNAGQWHPGIDRISGYLALMEGEFRKAAEAAA